MEDLASSLSCLLDFHMTMISDVARHDPELHGAVDLLSSSMEMVKRGKGFVTVQYHVSRVHAFGHGDKELDLHLSFLTELVHVFHKCI